MRMHCECYAKHNFDFSCSARIRPFHVNRINCIVDCKLRHFYQTHNLTQYLAPDTDILVSDNSSKLLTIIEPSKTNDETCYEVTYDDCVFKDINVSFFSTR